MAPDHLPYRLPTTSPVFGTLGDCVGRGGRTKLIALGIAVWSAGTVVTGLAQGTGSMIAARSGARALIELIVSVLSGRLVEEQSPVESSAAASSTSEPATAEYGIEPNPPENTGEGETEQPSEPAATPESD